MEQEKNCFEGPDDCECGGQKKHLYNTEDEELTYQFYKCKNCGEITSTDKPKY